jgi:hypothetical protein
MLRRLCDAKLKDGGARYGGIVLDLDGRLAPLLKAHYGERVVRIGPGGGAHVNLLDFPTGLLRSVVSQLATFNNFFHKEGPYWGSIVPDDVILLGEALRCLAEGAAITLVDVLLLFEYQYTQRMKNELGGLQHTTMDSPRLARQARRVLSSINSRPVYSAWRAHESGDDRKQCHWHYAAIDASLRAVDVNPFLRAAFSSRRPNVTVLDLLATKRIVVLDCPIQQYGPVVQIVAWLLCEQLRRHGGDDTFLVADDADALGIVSTARDLATRLPVVATMDAVEDVAGTVSDFGSLLVMSTLQPAIISWLTVVFGESCARNVIQQSSAGKGFAVLRRTASSSGQLTYGEFIAQEDPTMCLRDLLNGVGKCPSTRHDGMSNIYRPASRTWLRSPAPMTAGDAEIVCPRQDGDKDDLRLLQVDPLEKRQKHERQSATDYNDGYCTLAAL